MKKNKKPLVIVLILTLLIGVGILAYFQFSQSITVGSSINVYTVDYGRLECSEDDVEITLVKWLDQQTKFDCGDDWVVDGCQFRVQKTGSAGLLQTNFLYYDICDLNGNNCVQSGSSGILTHYQTYTSSEIFIASGKSLVFKNIKDPEYFKVTGQWNPYRLYTYENGGKYLTNSADCCLSNQDELSRSNIEYGQWDCMARGEFRNYFLDWKLSYTDKVFNYNGDNVLCRNQALYEIDSEKLANGVTRYLQGNKIKNVECCPQQDDNCNSETFKFVETGQEENIECTYDYQCGNAGDPYNNPLSSTTAYIEECESGQCVRSTIEIECERDSQCQSGYVCDLSNDNYGNCILASQNTYCGDGICQRNEGESESTCSEDCGVIGGSENDNLQCNPFFQTQKTKSRISFLGLTLREPEEYCALRSWVKWTIGLGIVALIIWILVLLKRKNINIINQVRRIRKK